MSHEIDIARLADAIKKKRVQKGLGTRATAEEIGGVSHSTLSRIENLSLPDLDTYIRICRWLEVTPNHFAKNVKDQDNEREELSLPDQFILHLRADKTLASETRKALETMIKVAYEAARMGLLNDEGKGKELTT